MGENQWPAWARPATDDEVAHMKHLERVYQRYEQLSADVILLIGALQQIEYHTTDKRAAKRARSGLDDYERARKAAEQGKTK